MTPATLRAFLAQWIPIESAESHGSIQQRERIAAVAELVAQEHAGDFVEIGCLNGSTTVMLAEVARRYGRRVIAIDPFTPGTQNVEPQTFEIFQRTAAPYADVIDFMQMRSDDSRVWDFIKGDKRLLAMAFVDGLHTFDATFGDIVLVETAPVIAVDDTKDMQEVRAGFANFVRWSEYEPENVRTAITVSQFRESWIV